MEMNISLCVAEFWLDAEARNEPGSFEAGPELLNEARTLNPRILWRRSDSTSKGFQLNPDLSKLDQRPFNEAALNPDLPKLERQHVDFN